MKLNKKITLLISLSLIIPAVLIGIISIASIYRKSTADIEEYRADEVAKLRLYLKHITDVAYGIIESQDQLAEDSNPADSTKNRDAIMREALVQLSKLRFDNGEGYFWVTDNQVPFPTMIMHAEKADLAGQMLDDPKYNVEKEHGRNIYQVRAELVNAHGDAFVEYVMKKPGTTEVENKISYSRLYKPLGWIVSTGFYTDQIDKAVAAKKEALSHQIRNTVAFIVGIGIVVLAIGLVIAFYFGKGLSRAVVSISEKLAELAKGRQVENVVTDRKDEIGGIVQSLNQLVAGLRTYTSFAKEIGRGNLGQQFETLSDHDELGAELILMRDNLRNAETEKSLRDWSNEGLAKLGEVLRRNNSDTRHLAEEVLVELVRYMKINQGGLFLIMDSEKRELELVASYAYERKKHLQSTVHFGEGLVGQCVLERKPIHLREVPAEYIKITSGLGLAVPRTIILVPLIFNEVVYGVIELASFNVFEPHEIAFLERVAESIASTVSTVQVNENTKNLLHQSQIMAEELRAQEEEVRQNMEELSATQEQMGRQIAETKKMQDDFQVRENVIAISTILSETDPNGNILLVNEKLCQVSRYRRDELIGKSHSIIRHADMSKDLFENLWGTISSGRVFRGIIKNRTKDGDHYWVDATIAPVKDESGKIIKYVSTQYHIAHEDLAIELYNQQAAQRNLPQYRQKLTA